MRTVADQHATRLAFAGAKRFHDTVDASLNEKDRHSGLGSNGPTGKSPRKEREHHVVWRPT